MNMKRVLSIILLASVLALMGCGNAVNAPVATPTAEPAATPAPTPTPEPTPIPAPTATPEPETEAGTAIANGVGALIASFMRGDAVEATGENGDCYIITVNGVEALIEKRLVRLDGAEPFEAYKGYAQKNAPVYASVYLTGEATATLKRNTEVSVEDALGDAVYITWDGGSGYAPASEISDKKLSSGGGGGGGGSSDGGDIQLSAITGGVTVRLASRRALTFPCAASVLGDGSEAYLALFAFGDEVRVVSTDDEGVCTLLVNGALGTLPRRFIRMEGDAEYAEWDGYTEKNAPFFASFRLAGASRALKKNTVVRVLADLGDSYLVRLDDELGYIEKERVKDKKIASSGGGGGGSWTEPAL